MDGTRKSPARHKLVLQAAITFTGGCFPSLRAGRGTGRRTSGGPSGAPQSRRRSFLRALAGTCPVPGDEGGRRERVGAVPVGAGLDQAAADRFPPDRAANRQRDLADGHAADSSPEGSAVLRGLCGMTARCTLVGILAITCTSGLVRMVCDHRWTLDPAAGVKPGAYGFKSWVKSAPRQRSAPEITPTAGGPLVVLDGVILRSGVTRSVVLALWAGPFGLPYDAVRRSRWSARWGRGRAHRMPACIRRARRWPPPSRTCHVADCPDGGLSVSWRW